MRGIFIAGDRRICRQLRRENRRRNFPAILGLALLVIAEFSATAAAAQATGPDFVQVKTQSFAPQLVAYGQIEPISVATVSAAETGVITDLRVRPGSHVSKGERLARLSGPAIASLLLQSQADVRSAKAQLDAAQKSLAIQQEELPSHLTTRQALHQSQSAVAQARAALDNAHSKQYAIQQMTTLTAPADGIVLSLAAADGALVSAGQTVLAMRGSGGLWLRATYYGSDLALIRLGMTGMFAPSDGGEAIPVRVVSIPGTVMVGGGESIALKPIRSRSVWLSGEAGTVTLRLPERPMVVVPTRALIVNQGKWWVLVHTPAGNRPQQVVPGPAKGWNTFLESGLAAGTEIVVNNAYLLFHSGIAEQFQIPD